MTEQAPKPEQESPIARRFTTFIDTYVDEVLPDQMDCRKRGIIDHSSPADLVIVSRYDADPQQPTYHLTQTSRANPEQNALTMTYNSARGFELITVVPMPLPPDILADALLDSFEHAKATGHLEPVNEPMG